MNSKRLNGHRLLFVIALIGILSIQVISADDAAAETTESGPTTAAAEDSTVATVDEATTLVAHDSPEASTGEAGTSAEASVTVATGDGGAETTAGTSVGVGTEGDGTETTAGETGGTLGGATASAGELSTSGTGAVKVPTGSDETGTTVLGSSREGTEGGTTATVTGTPSIDVTGTEKLPAQEDTKGITTTEENTASMVQTKERTTVEYTSVGHTGSKGQTETTVAKTGTEQPTAFTSALARTGCMTLDTIKINSTNTVFSITNGKICEVKGKAKYNYNVTVDYVNEANPNELNTSCSIYETEIKYEVNSSAVATHLKGVLSSGKRFRRDAEMIAIEVPRTLTIEEVKNALHETFTDLITGTKKTPHQDNGKAPDGIAQAPNPSTSGTVWEAHYGLFLTVVILISVCVVVSAVCCLCMAWRRRGQDKHSDKQPIAMEEAREAPVAVSNPIPDAEMIQDEAPMQERENPAVTPNGGGQHISKADEDNGWVVPLDELSKAEKEKPEVENTRL